MKWHKFDVDFWSSATAFHLKKQFGYRGLVQWLRLISVIAKDIQSWSDVQHAHKVGWTKPFKEWAKIAGTYEKDVKKMLTSMQHLKKVDVHISDDHFCTLRFTNFAEFVHKDALSSKSRKHRGGPKDIPVAGQTKAGGRALDNIADQPPAVAGPVGSPGQPTGYHGVDSNGWSISNREQAIIERAEWAKREDGLEEPVFSPVYIDEPAVEAILKPEIKSIAGGDTRSFEEKRIEAQALAAKLRSLELHDSAKSGGPPGGAPDSLREREINGK